MSNEELIKFCAQCFASSDNSSWGEPITEAGCMNCGRGPAFVIPRWAVESIRAQASWVGKRYYPHEEDTERAEELDALRALAPDDPERTVKKSDVNPRAWEVTQPTPKGFVSVVVAADSEVEALAKGKLRLPYRPQKKEESGE